MFSQFTGDTEKMISNILWAVLLGAILGSLARLILPGKQNISVPVTILAGMAAAFVGWAIAAIFGFADTRGFDWWERILQVLLALVAVSFAVRRYPAKPPRSGSTPPAGRR